jgi:FlaA1/EpsC-like NDP-sugar epimerase
MQSQPGWKCSPERTRRIPGYSSMPEQRKIFITGGTGYMGQRLIRSLLDRGHQVRALVR